MEGDPKAIHTDKYGNEETTLQRCFLNTLNKDHPTLSHTDLTNIPEKDAKVDKYFLTS